MGPDGPPPILASDAEREHACTVLREASVEGRLTLDEFGQRVERALAARTREELSAVTVDLPAIRSRPGSDRPPVRWLVAIMSGIQRRGFWRIGEDCHAVSILGGCTIDLRGAVISAPVTTIRAVAVMGGIDVIVPDGIEVELEGIALMGGKDLRLQGPPPPPGAPVVRVVALSLMGSVTVRDRPSLGERLRRALEDQFPRR